MKAALTAALLLLATVSAQADQQGSSSTHGNSTTFTDHDGHFAGSAIRNSDGTTSFYDRRGHFTGSSTSTRQPR